MYALGALGLFREDDMCSIKSLAAEINNKPEVEWVVSSVVRCLQSKCNTLGLNPSLSMKSLGDL